MTTQELRMRCQRCGEQMVMRDPEPGGPWKPDQFWVCPNCGRHFWTTYAAPPSAAPPKTPAPDAAGQPKAPPSAAKPTPAAPATAGETPPVAAPTPKSGPESA